MKKIFVKSLAVLLVCLFVISGINFSISAATTTDHGETLSAMNISISGNISLMFYFKNLDNVSYFQVTVPQKDGSDKVTTVDKNDLKYDSSTGRYLLTVKLPAAQQADLVTVQAFNSAGQGGKIRQHSVKGYAEKLFALGRSDATYLAAVEAVKFMLNYGAMAQRYFNHNTSSLANDGLYYRSTNPLDAMNYEDLYGITDSSYVTAGSGVAISNVNAYLEDTVSIRCYIDLTGYSGTVNDLSVAINGTLYDNQILQDETGYYVLINNIPATKFNTRYKVAVGDGTNIAEVEYSVLNYLQARLAKTDDENLKNVAYSMFQFYVATSKYVGNTVTGADAHTTACRHDRTYIDIHLGNKILCSDCSGDRGTSGTYNLNGSTVTTNSGMSYTVAGGNFEADAEDGMFIPYGSTMNLTGSTITSDSSKNYFTLKYYSSAPVKVTLNYSYGSSYTNKVGEYYYLEAGENTFTAFDWSVFAYATASSSTSRNTANSKYDKLQKYSNQANSYFRLDSISITPLTEDGASFVLFNYSNEGKTTTVTKKTISGANTVYHSFVYAENSRYKLGISLTYGGAVTELYDLAAGTSTSDSTNGKITKDINLINNYDTGRLIQQSYYGTFGDNDGYLPRYYSVPDSTVDSGYKVNKWNYNPVQAGDEIQGRARLIDLATGTDSNGNTYIYVKVQPRDWAGEDSNGNAYSINDSRYTECYMENRYTLTSSYIQVDNRLVDFSGYDHPYNHQELPAIYTLSYFDDYYWYKGTKPWTNDSAGLKREDKLPFWGDPANVARTTFNYELANTETWGAYVNESNKYGIGVYVPNIDVIKGGITTAEGYTSSTAEPSSYFTPMKILKMVSFEPIEYSYLICAGHIDTIRQTFTENKDFSSNISLNKNDIPQKYPNEQDMTNVDFSLEDNLLFFQGVNNAVPSYDVDQQAAKLTVDGDDSYFYINYDLYSTVYTTTNYSCIEIEYMIPANSTLYPAGTAGGQELFWQVGSNKQAGTTCWSNNIVTFIADGQYHTARIYTSSLSGWSGQINSLRFDFLNDGISSGQEIYIKSIKLTNRVESNANDQFVSKLDFSYTGAALASQITDGNWDAAGAFSAIVIDEDYVRVTGSGSVGDRYFGMHPGGSTVTGKYMVVKYRTSATPHSGLINIFATANTTDISGNGDFFQAPGLVSDGNWHTLVIDMSQSGAVVAKNGKYYLNWVRFDIFNSIAGTGYIDFAYVGFCDSISDIKLASDEHLEYSSDLWTLSMDVVSMDGTVVAEGAGRDYTTGATYQTPLSGSEFALGGWFGIANQKEITDISYCVVDEAGIEHWTSIPAEGESDFIYNVHGSYVAESGVQNALAGFNCTGYRLYTKINLEEYTGQTVKLSIRAVTSDGHAVTLLATTVSILEHVNINPNWNMNVDTLYYCTADDFSDITAATSKVANSATQNTIFDGAINARYLLMATLDGSYAPTAWFAVDGYDLSGMSYTIYKDGAVVGSGACTIIEAEIGVQNVVKDNLGYSDSTVAYRVASPLISVAEWSGSQVTVVFSVTLKNVNTDPIEVLSITVNAK